MQAPEVRRAVAAALSTASALGLSADDAIVLQASNKLSLRLLPCDVLARVGATHQDAQFEIELAQQLAAAGSPVAALDPRVEPRVYARDGYAITLWTYYESTAPQQILPADYADALHRLHAGMRNVDARTPHFTDRIEQAQQLVASPDRTPALAGADREFLGATLRDLGAAVARHSGAEQLLHGEPHPGNVLNTRNGPLFIDFETCCRGPVEFDLAHAPDGVSEHYPGVDRALLSECGNLVLALVTTWRWDRDDRFPDGHRLGTQWLGRLRTGLDRHAPG
jgi:aminoglycoside phosphotransferase (APT) family kinase protein